MRSPDPFQEALRAGKSIQVDGWRFRPVGPYVVLQDRQGCDVRMVRERIAVVHLRILALLGREVQVGDG